MVLRILLHKLLSLLSSNGKSAEDVPASNWNPSGGPDNCECGLRTTTPSPRLNRLADNHVNNKELEKKEKNLPTRYILVFMGFLAFVNVYVMYLNLIVAWPVMVDHNATRISDLDDQKGVFFEKNEINPEFTNTSTYQNSLRERRHQETVENLSNSPIKENNLDDQNAKKASHKLSTPHPRLTPPKMKSAHNVSPPSSLNKNTITSQTASVSESDSATINHLVSHKVTTLSSHVVDSSLSSGQIETISTTPSPSTKPLKKKTNDTRPSDVDSEKKLEHNPPSTTISSLGVPQNEEAEIAPKVYEKDRKESSERISTLKPKSRRRRRRSPEVTTKKNPSVKGTLSQRDLALVTAIKDLPEEVTIQPSSEPATVIPDAEHSSNMESSNFEKGFEIPTYSNSLEDIEVTTEIPAADLSITILVNNETQVLSDSSIVLETESPLSDSSLEELFKLSTVTIDATTQIPNIESYTELEVTSEIETVTTEYEDTTQIFDTEDKSLNNSTPENHFENTTSSVNSTSKPTEKTFLNSYDIIDKKGSNDNHGSQDNFLSSLLHKNRHHSHHHHHHLNSKARKYRLLKDLRGDDDEDSEEEEDSSSDEDSDENKLPRLLFKLSDNFKLINCSGALKLSNSDLDGDIKCLSSLGIISFTLVGADDSSSSSSSSEEDSDEEEEDSEDEDEDEDEEDEEEEEDDEEEEEDEEIEVEKEEEGEEGDEEEEEDENENEDEKEKENDEDSHKGRYLNKYGHFPLHKDPNDGTTRGEGMNQEVTNIRKTKTMKKSECEDSSEECEDEEEEEDVEEDEEEEEENKKSDQEEDEEGTANSPKGLIRLDEKFPSHVCFYKKKIKTLSFEGYKLGEFKWEPHLQNHLTSAYYWGFLVSQIPASKLTGIIGGKLVLLAAILFAGFTTLLTPALAQQGVYWLLTGRIFLGMMQGMAMPALHCLLAKWAPPLERTRMVAYAYSGIAVGAALGGPFSAFLVDRIGWRALFYGQGGFAVLWAILWFLLIAESPSSHPRISEREKNYIVTAIGQKYAGKRVPIPWCSIIKSKHVLSLMLAHGAFGWAWHTLLHHAPRYIATVLHDNLPDVQRVWAAALGCMFVITCALGTLADWAQKSRRVSTISVRRSANSLCSLLTAAFLVGVAQAYCNAEAVKVSFAMAITIGLPGAIVGLLPNSIDMSPNHAAAIIGITGTFATTSNILAPYYWVLTVFGQPTLERWRTIWYTSAIFLLLANCLFFLLVGAKEQSWNRPPPAPKPQRRRDDEHIVPLPRRRHYTHGIKNPAFMSTERL